MAKGFKVFDTDMQTDVIRFPDGEEMPTNWSVVAENKLYGGKLAWRPTTLIKPTFDNEIETRTFTSRVIADDDVTVTYTVTDKDLATVKSTKKSLAKQTGKGIILAKHGAEQQCDASLSLLTAGEITAIKDDITTIRNYYKNTFKPAVNAATTVQEVKAVAINFPPI